MLSDQFLFPYGYVDKILNLLCDPTCDYMPYKQHPHKQDGHYYACDGHLLIDMPVELVDYHELLNYEEEGDVRVPHFADCFTSGRLKGQVDLQSLSTVVNQLEGNFKRVYIAQTFVTIEYMKKAIEMMLCMGAVYAEVCTNKDDSLILASLVQGSTVRCLITCLRQGSSDEPLINGAFAYPLVSYIETPSGDVLTGWHYGTGVLEKRAEAERKRLASRRLWHVSIHKIAYVPVYAESAEAAEDIVNHVYIDDDIFNDSDWNTGPYVPEEVSRDDAKIEDVDGVYMEGYDDPVAWEDWNDEYGDAADEDEDDNEYEQ